jgi:hypothetical protein
LVYQTMCCRGGLSRGDFQRHGPCDDASCRFNYSCGNLGFGRQRPKGSLLDELGLDGGVADIGID